MEQNPLISFENVTLRLRDQWLLPQTNWQVNRGENWVVWGANGAGKTTLARAVMGQVAVVRGCIRRHHQACPGSGRGQPGTALVSSDQYHQLIERERLQAEMRHFSSRCHEITAAGQILNAAGTSNNTGQWHAIQNTLALQPLLAKPVEALSSGEMRKLLLGRALLRDPHLLILDEPFNGLDSGSRAALAGILAQLADGGTQLLLITHRRTEIPSFFSHLLHLEQGRVVWQGRIEDFHHLETGQPRPEADRDESARVSRHALDSRPAEINPAELIRMRRVSVTYEGNRVLDTIDWTVRQGENWALIGPNGSGKTTLLKLITGDNLQGYANDLILFGQRKGVGATIWETKKYIGYIGDDLQARYQRTMSGFDVICSGFFDSVGLYRLCTPEQHTVVRNWIERLNLQDLSTKRFAHLSFGQQRLILIARAMVKSPLLLILDEPFNGLDEPNRVRLLQILETIGRGSASQLILVSHRTDEIPSCITHRLYLEAGRISAVRRVTQPDRDVYMRLP